MVGGGVLSSTGTRMRQWFLTDFALLFFSGSHRSLAHARPVSVDVIRANSERGSAVSRRQSSFYKHLFINPKSFPSTRPVKTTPTEAHNWSRKRQRANQRSLASGNARHIHTALELMEFRSTGKISLLGTRHLRAGQTDFLQRWCVCICVFVFVFCFLLIGTVCAREDMGYVIN